VLQPEEWPNIDFDDNRTMSRCLHALGESRAHLARWIIEQDIRNKLTSQAITSNREKAGGYEPMEILMAILYAVDEQVLRSIIKGTYIYDTIQDQWDNLSIRIPPVSRGAKDHRPVIYGHWWVDSHYGEAPTKTQCEFVLKVMDKYIGGIDAVYYKLKGADFDSIEVPEFVKVRLARSRLVDFIVEIDTYEESHLQLVDGHLLPPGSWTNYHWEMGRRRYVPNVRQLEQIQAWLLAMRARLARIPPGKEDSPIPWAVCEIGWTKDPDLRSRQHASHSSSIPLMNLVGQCCCNWVVSSF